MKTILALLIAASLSACGGHSACHAGGPLISGETLPGAVCTIKTRMTK